MVVCAVRYELVSLLFAQYQGVFRRKQRTGGRKFQKPLQHRHFSNIAPIRYQGETGSAKFLQTPSEHLRNWEGGVWPAGSGHSDVDRSGC
jgi:hypothetical protein